MIKKIAFGLLKKMKLPYFNRGKGKNSKLGKLFYMLKADIKVLQVARQFKPDLFLSFSSPYAAQVSFLLGKTARIWSLLSRFRKSTSDSLINVM